ncbi:MAG: cysteine hydrolase [Candidatus Omnitrophota bacterium]|nr:MAG: cysteine hydrolase [Candidatus Omnitrophota bacterium]
MNKKALLICDMLNDFVRKGAPLEAPGATDIIPNIRREMENARRDKVPIIYICDSHVSDDPEMNVWPLHAIKGTNGAEIIAELAPDRNDIIIEKTRYDAFYQTNLEAKLQQLQITEIILTGVCTEICIHYTGSSAIMRGYRVAVPEDCVAGLEDANASAALCMLKRVLQPQMNSQQ